MNHWSSLLSYDPITPLLGSDSPFLTYFVYKDLLNRPVPSIESLWDRPPVTRLLEKQQTDGSWNYQGKKINPYPPNHYPLVATFKVYRRLIERFGLNRNHPGCACASEFILSCQTSKGDIRGMIGDQYATYYTGYMLSLLIKAGYDDDPRIKKGLDWLLSMRQDDGGWTIPMLTHYLDRKTTNRITSTPSKTLEPDRTQPFSHHWTAMVLQGFVVHPNYKNNPEIIHAANLLKSRFFQKDVYGSYQSADYWVRFAKWWPNLLSSLIILSHLGFPNDDPDIEKGLQWFIANQKNDGLWDIQNNPKKTMKKNSKTEVQRQWLTLNICRMLHHYFP